MESPFVIRQYHGMGQCLLFLLAQVVAFLYGHVITNRIHLLRFGCLSPKKRLSLPETSY